MSQLFTNWLIFYHDIVYKLINIVSWLCILLVYNIIII